MEENLTTTDKVQELQRKLYLKAKSQPNFRFYALYDRIYRADVLRKAWQKLNKQGVPGIDGQTIKDIEEEGVEEYLKDIQQELKANEYRPQPAKRVYIPKPDGRQRPLGIPIIKDKVVEMALKIVIEPIFEADFEDNSYGFRPKRSTFLTDKLKLRLNLKKTRIANVEEESFDFLGYSFRKELNREKTKEVAYFWASKKAEKSIKEKVRRITNPARPVKVEQIVKELNPVMRGWVNYHKIGNSSKKFGKIRLYVANKVRKFMMRQRNMSGYGYKRYTDEYLYKKLGLYRDYRLIWAKALG